MEVEAAVAAAVGVAVVDGVGAGNLESTRSWR